MPLITAGCLSCLRCVQSTLYTHGGEARVELHKTYPMVSSDVDVLVVHGDERSHEEASERVSTVPGQDRAEASRDPC